MKSFFTPLAVVASLAAAVSAQTFTINSLSNVVVCQPTLITWVGGQPPYFLTNLFLLSILPAGQPDANSLVDLGQQNGSSVTWLANLAVGTSGFLDLRDNTGALAQSGSFTINPGSNTTCVGQPVSQSAGAPVAPVTTGSGATTGAPPSPATTTSSSSAGTTGATTKSSTTTTGTTAKPTTSSGAISKYATAGGVVMLGSAILGLAL